MRKIKYTQENYTEKLQRLLDEFPRLDDIHPFYADLVNVLYSRDHYKLALGQIGTARSTIDTLGKDYLKLLKMGDSLYRCKQLKRAALGRMCTCMTKLKASLSYLEQVRMHLSRLPSIDPNTRTLLITGYPNVGKSSFINRVSRADVDVQPYAFTTKSLFVGHTDYKYSRWQVIDTPGILDHPLEDRNTIEMQAITALAHLQSTILFFIDISESCGYSIKQQVSLFHNIKPLFQNKPLLIVVNKIDLKPWEQVDAGDKELINTCAKEGEIQIIPMSNQTMEGIEKVKETGCNMLLMRRVERKLRSSNVDSFANRIAVVRPTARDRVERPIAIPQSVKAVRKLKETNPTAVPKRQTLKAIELLNGGPGVYNFDLRNHWQLANDEWRFDAIPEIMDGKNVADFIDPDIEARLDELEREEAELEAKDAEEREEGDMESDLDDEERVLVKEIRTKKFIATMDNKLKHTSHPVLPRKVRPVNLEEAEAKLQEIGLDTSKFRRRAIERVPPKRRRSERGAPANEDAEMGEETGAQQGEAMDVEDETSGTQKKKKARVESTERSGSASRSASRAGSRSKPNLRSESLVAASRSRSRSVQPRNESGFKDTKTLEKAKKMRKSIQKDANRESRKGEADRHVFDLRPKHLYSGKRKGFDTADWR